MDSTKIVLFYDDCQAEVTLENHGDDTVAMCVVELEKDEARSTNKETALKPRSTTEIYLGPKEAAQLVETLNFIIPKE
ncbi:hypothetical protein J22TS1_44200 [Siminovitchia terrae]|uniref:hypothetical protein n=1 Tax=Siminovitchia terrae TaxID=1914933 RepID=UPI001B07FA45|nr:hypothetical protein [Siminovitchia terrae]GIN93369.1 hypothetical protein J22TS1_44200 [Siminovitchia terrae]